MQDHFKYAEEMVHQNGMLNSVIRRRAAGEAKPTDLHLLSQTSIPRGTLKKPVRGAACVLEYRV